MTSAVSEIRVLLLLAGEMAAGFCLQQPASCGLLRSAKPCEPSLLLGRQAAEWKAAGQRAEPLSPFSLGIAGVSPSLKHH